jgi:hypothetical protein
MTDVPVEDVSLQQESVAKPDAYTPASLPPLNPLTLAPPLGSPLSASVKLEGSPLKNVVPLSPPQVTKVEMEETAAAPPVAESTIAEPPSTIVGEGPDAALERDVPMAGVPTDEALLPPPPDQVGNIASPKAGDALEEQLAQTETASAPEGSAPVSTAESASASVVEPASALERPSLAHLDSVMTDDSIKPEDSASVISPLENGSSEKAPAATEAAASEAGNAPGTPSTAQAVVEGAQEAPEDKASPKPEAAEVAPEIAPEPAAEESAPIGEAALPEQEDILGGAMAALDRQAQDDVEAAAPPKESQGLAGTDAPTEQPAPAAEAPTTEPEPASTTEEKPESDEAEAKPEAQVEAEAVKPESPKQAVPAGVEAEAEVADETKAEPTEPATASTEQAGLAAAASDADESKQAPDNDDGKEEGAAPANA